MSSLDSRLDPDKAARLAAHEAHWQRWGVRRAGVPSRQPTVSTGWRALDAVLPDGGYPESAVTELLVAEFGIGEFSLLLACLRVRLAADSRARLALIAPPARLNAPALSAAGIDRARVPVVHARDDGERVWCVEQMAATRGFAGFVVWGDDLDTTALRRLQLAAENAHCPVFVYRGLEHAVQRSPAALRLALASEHGRQRIEVRKCRGPAGARLSGLAIDGHRPWHMPAAPSAFTSGAAYNDDDHDVARAALPPLGPR